jgi:hypothetical protein
MQKARLATLGIGFGNGNDRHSYDHWMSIATPTPTLYMSKQQPRPSAQCNCSKKGRFEPHGTPTWTPVWSLLGHHIAVRRVSFTVADPVAKASNRLQAPTDGQTATARTCAVRRVGYTSHFGCGDEIVVQKATRELAGLDDKNTNTLSPLS